MISQHWNSMGDDCKTLKVQIDGPEGLVAVNHHQADMQVS